MPSGVQYALQEFPGGLLVSDGHHNRVLRVSRHGDIRELAAFGNVVPTGLDVRGRHDRHGRGRPDSASPRQWQGHPLDVRVAPATEVASGASLIVDVEFGRRWGLYALSQGVWDLPPTPENEGKPAAPNTGRLLRVARDGSLACGRRRAGPANIGSSSSTTRRSSSRSPARCSGSTAYVFTLGAHRAPWGGGAPEGMTGILLIHGAWHGPWSWDEFAARLAGRGHDVRTVRLRGHEQSGERIWHRIRDYLEDVQEAAERFAEPPVLVGHSMGGSLAQRYAQRHPAAAIVLLASVPPGSAIRVAARLAMRGPAGHGQRDVAAACSSRSSPPRAQTRAMFFTEDTPDAIVDRCHAKLKDESYLALLKCSYLRCGDPRSGVPVLVLGATDNAIISADDVHRTARAYDTQAELFDGIGHDMTLDAGWEHVADRVDAWVRRVRSPTKDAA